MHLAILERCVDRALLARVRAAVGFRMVHHLVLLLADHFLAPPTRQVDCRWIDKRCSALRIQPEYPLAGGGQDELVVASQPIRLFAGLLLFGHDSSTAAAVIL